MPQCGNKVFFFSKKIEKERKFLFLQPKKKQVFTELIFSKKATNFGQKETTRVSIQTVLSTKKYRPKQKRASSERLCDQGFEKKNNNQS